MHCRDDVAAWLKILGKSCNALLCTSERSNYNLEVKVMTSSPRLKKK